jgi:hydroxymethylpyrimidine pyrophosphatase-like HAD family hydrolase
MMDIDGVLDRMVFGFPCTTAAGIKAISLLHSHGFPVAANTARTLREVKQYAQCYGFVGGVAEYGSVIWDAISDREQVLVSPESLLQLEEARAALRRIPGCYLNDDYRYSIRAFSYQNGQTIPLPPLLAQDLLSSLRLDRLRLHQTGLDTAIVARETDKGVGSASLLEFAGLLNAEVLAIGDSAPDLPMFRAASRAFAPGNVSCRREAELLGCYVARRIVHPAGDSCDICRAVEEEWSRKEGLFVSLLCAADQKPTSLLVRNLMNLDILEVFRKSSVH